MPDPQSNSYFIDIQMFSNPNGIGMESTLGCDGIIEKNPLVDYKPSK
jgi:hypothetical protein